MASLNILVILTILIVNFSTASEKVLICYYGTWATYRSAWGKVDVEDIHPNICTHLVYTFVGINLDGTIAILDPGLDLPSGKDNFRKFNALKQQNPKLKTILAVGGYNEGSYKYSLMAASSTMRNNFIQSASNLVLEYDFDGLDMDWEYPSRRDSAYGTEDINNFSILLKELREEFDKHGLLLTAAVACVPSMAALSYDIATISNYLDYVNIMAYDMHGAWDSVTGHNAALHHGEGDSNIAREDAYTVDVSVEYWLSQGCPPEKLVLGLPLYGRTFTLASANMYGVRAPAVGAGLSGPYTLTSGFLGYNEFCVKLQSENWDVFYDSKAKVPYAVLKRNWVSYDDDNSLMEKVKYIMNLDIAGAMVWSIETDDVHAQCHSETYHLLRTVNRAMGRQVSDSSDVETATTTTTTAPDSATMTTITTDRLTTLSATTASLTNTTVFMPEVESSTSSPVEFLCQEAGSTSDPKDCSNFYVCHKDATGNWIASKFECPGILVWDNTHKFCNYPDQVNCNA